MKQHGLNPRIRKSPYFEATLRAGAKEFHPYNGMWMPVGYDSPVNEYWNLITNCGLWDVTVQRVVEISGPDAGEFMNRLTPRSIDHLSDGACRYVFLTSPSGGVLNDPVLLKLAADRFWLSTADSDMYLWANGVRVNAGLDVDVSLPEVSTLQVQGPTSPLVVSELLGDHVLDLGYYEWTSGAVDGLELLVSRTGYSAEIGFELYLFGHAGGEHLWERLLEIGEPHGLKPGSPNRIRRIEAGILDYGADIDVHTNPYELAYDRMVAIDKPYAFIGKEALTRIAEHGPRRRIVGLFLDGPAFERNNEHRWRILQDGAQVGEVTAAVHSPRLERNIAMGFLHTGTSHSSLTVESPEGTRAAEVTGRPFIDPDKLIPRQPLR